jgi:hypothetical protein
MNDIYIRNHLTKIGDDWVIDKKDIRELNNDIIIRFLFNNKLIINLSKTEFIIIQKVNYWYKLECNDYYEMSVHKLYKRSGTIFSHSNILVDNPYIISNNNFDKSKMIIYENPNSLLTWLPPYLYLTENILFRTTESYYKFVSSTDLMRHLRAKIMQQI